MVLSLFASVASEVAEPPSAETMPVADAQAAEVLSSSEASPDAPTSGKLLSGKPVEGGFLNPAPREGIGGQLAMAMLMAMVLVIGVVWFLMKKGKLPFRGLADSGSLHIRETRMLGNKQFLVVVEYEGKKMLIGVGPGFISHLCSLNTQPVASDKGEFDRVFRKEVDGA